MSYLPVVVSTMKAAKMITAKLIFFLRKSGIIFKKIEKLLKKSILNLSKVYGIIFALKTLSICEEARANQPSLPESTNR